MNYTRLITKGVSGEDVIFIKGILFSLGYYSQKIKEIKSKSFSDDSVLATKRFQKANKDDKGISLVVDGQIGEKTWGAILREFEKKNAPKVEPVEGNPYAEPKKNYSANSSFNGNDAYWFQWMLEAIGHLIVVDGKAGPKTWEALNFEIRQANLSSGADFNLRTHLKNVLASRRNAPAPNPVAEPELFKLKHIGRDKLERINSQLQNVSSLRQSIVFELVNWAVDANNPGGSPRALYVFATDLYNKNLTLNVSSVEQIEKQARQYPTYFNGGRKDWMIAQILKNPALPAADCSGTIVGILRKHKLVSAAFDAIANSLASNTHSTKISKDELAPGDWVARPGHIGVYVGGGFVVELYGGAFGCQLTDLNKREGFDFIKGKITTGSLWTSYRKPKYY